MRAIIVRHYRTLLNASDKIMGWGDAPRVEGWQADLDFVVDTLQKFEINCDAIFSSDLERARQTAMYFARSQGIHIVHDSSMLNEINYGLLYKKSKKWVAKNIPQHKTDPDFVYPGGESFHQMQKRSVDYLLSQAEILPEKTILIVVHAGIIRGFISQFLGLDYASHLKEKISHRYIGEFLFKGQRCVQYNELGKASGFVRKRFIEIPHTCSDSAATNSRRIGSFTPARIYPSLGLTQEQPG